MFRLQSRRNAVSLALVFALSFVAGCARPGRAAVSELAAGSEIKVRLLDALDTSTSRAGDEFTAAVSAPLILDGQVVIPAGAPVRGFVQKSVSVARAAERSMLSIGLRSIEINQRRLELETYSIARVSGDHKKRSMVPVTLTTPEGEDEVRIPTGTILAFRLREPLAL